MATTTKARFYLDFGNRKIVGSKASFAKASKGSGDIYNQLAALIENHPTFTFEVKEPEKPAKRRQTYKGMDYSFILDYLSAVEDTTTLKTVNDVIAFAKAMKKHSYPYVKRVLFDAYPKFDYSSAKKIVNNYRHKQMMIKANKRAEEQVKAAAEAEAAKKAASTAESAPDPTAENKPNTAIIPNPAELAPASGF